MLVSEDTTDRTEEIARSAGCRTARRRFDDYAGQRQAALRLCAGDWVLWIDADERASPALASEIRSRLDGGSAPAAGFEIPFEVVFLGRTLRFGGLGRERHLRLFRRQGAEFVGGALHEGLKLGGAPGAPLSARIRHEPYRDLSEYLAKLDRYTTLAARKKFEAGQRFSLWQHLVLPWELFRRVVLRAAFLDGAPGLTWAGLSAFHHWLKYVKLRELSRKE